MESNFCAPRISNNPYIPLNYQLAGSSRKDITSLIETAEVITLHKGQLPERTEMEEIVGDNIERFGYTIRITNSEGYGNITGGIMLLERLLDLSENLKIKLIFDDEIDLDTQLTAEKKFDKLCAGNERINKVLVDDLDKETSLIIGLTGTGDIDYTEKDQVTLNAEILSLMSNCNTFLHLQPYGYKHSSRAIYTSKLNGEITIAKFGDDLKSTGYDLQYTQPSVSELLESIPTCDKLSPDEQKKLHEILEQIHDDTKNEVVNVVVVYGVDQYSHAASTVVHTITGSLEKHPNTFVFVIYSGEEKLDSCISLEEFNVKTIPRNKLAVQCKSTNKKIFDFLISQAQFAAFEGAGTFATVLATETPFILFSQPNTIKERFAFREAYPSISECEESYEATTMTISKQFKAQTIETLLCGLHEKLPNSPIFNSLKEVLCEGASYLRDGSSKQLKALINSIKDRIGEIEIEVAILVEKRPKEANALKPIRESLTLLSMITNEDVDNIFDSSNKGALEKFADDAHDKDSDVNNYIRKVSECIKNQADQVIIGLYYIFANSEFGS